MTKGSNSYHASKFSARGLNSAPGTPILVILEISVNPLRKKKSIWGGVRGQNLASQRFFTVLAKCFGAVKMARVLVPHEGLCPWIPMVA